MKTATFQVDVTTEDASKFAALSGDWNPLHTDPVHAAKTIYKNTVLHGAFSAGLISRMAGMFIPGSDCLLHNMKLRFVAPIIPPTTLIVSAQLISENAGIGRVEVNVSDKSSGARYVEAIYEFGHHEVGVQEEKPKLYREDDNDAKFLITGASGGLGNALLLQLGHDALGVSRSELEGAINVLNYAEISESIGRRAIKGIIHCAWPKPDNVPFSKLEQPIQSIEHHVTNPLADIQALSRLLIDQGVKNAPLILIGSTFSNPGRHNYRIPLYSLTKSLIPNLSAILALEMAPFNRRCVSVIFDVIDGGMNDGISDSVRLSHADRSPSGELASLDVAASQILWVLENQSHLISGATISLSGGAMP